jgi:hypothetical protein
MSIASEIERIQRAKESIIETLKANDVEVQDGATMDDIDATMKEVPILDTSDATATAADIVKDKTAYVNGEKVVGTLEISSGEYNTKISTEGLSGTTFKVATTLKEIDFSNIDMSNITSMEYAFQNLEALEKIIGLDTSNVTNMSYMFSGCRARLNVAPELNTNKVKNMTYMFVNCINLKDIPIYDMSSCTNTSHMFSTCAALKTAPSFNLSGVRTMNNMFYNCMDLINVPVYSVISATNMSSMFKSSTALSDESLNNIMETCISNTGLSSSNKTLKYIGLTSNQATKCQSLSNYQAFLDAGWTTGY